MYRPRFRFWGFKTPRELVRTGLGSLERRLMDMVWQRGRVTVRQAHASLHGAVAYTTLMTTLDRLFKKGFLTRTKTGRAFVYEASISREELERAVAGEMIHAFLAKPESATVPFLSHLVDAVSEHDRALLDELDRLLQEKRRRLRNEDDE